MLGFGLSYCQIIAVTFFLLKRDYHTALVLHFVFFVSSVNFSYVDSTTLDELSTNYSKVKILGYLPISFAISVWLAFGYRKAQSCMNIHTFLTQAKLLLILASFLGLLGIFISTHSLHYFIFYFYYSVSAYLFLFIFSKAITTYNLQFWKYIVVLCLISSGFTSLLMYLFGMSTTYGGISIIPYNSLFIFTPLLLFIPFKKNILLWIIALISIGFVSIFSIGGKGVAFLTLILVLFFLKQLSKSTLIYLFIFSILLFLGLSQSSIFVQLTDGRTDLLSLHKFQQFFSIFNFSASSADTLEGISDSPKVRIAEILNIVYMYLSSPHMSIFGLGYGGGFQDYSGLFKFMDLTKGAFDDSQINSGIFYRPHDTIPVVLLLHGIAGLLFIFYWTIYFIVKHKKSALFLGGIPWLFLAYGFDLNIAFFGTLCVVLGFFESFNFKD